MLIDNHFIYFPDQCKYCTKGLNTTYCWKTQEFIKRLTELNPEGVHGSLDFKCDYFVFDKSEYYKDHLPESN